MTLRISALMIAAALAGCSSGGSDNKGGGTPTKISAGAAKALGGQAALLEAGSSLQGGRAAALLAAISAQSSPQGIRQQKAQKVGSALRPGAGCQMDFSANDPIGGSAGRESSSGGPSMTQFRPMTLTTQAGCPVEMTLKMELDGPASQGCMNPSAGEACRFKGRVIMKYNVRDQKLAEELEVSRGMVGMSFDIDQSMNAGSATASDVSMIMKNSASFEMQAVGTDGNIYALKGSQSMNVKMDMTAPTGPGQMPRQSIVGGAKEELHYLNESTNERSDMIATMTANGANGIEKYLIDGVEVSVQTYMTERQKLESAMMLFGGPSSGGSEQNGSPVPNPKPGPGPQPGPQPGPPPAPRPQPKPVPQPQPIEPSPIEPSPINPIPAPADKWICLVENYATGRTHAGYGAVELMANSRSKQTCQAGESPDTCGGSPYCEQRSAAPSWFCELKNYSTTKVFNGTGNSRLEAAYLARKACADVSGNRTSSCASIGSATCEQF